MHIFFFLSPHFCSFSRFQNHFLFLPSLGHNKGTAFFGCHPGFACSSLPDDLHPCTASCPQAGYMAALPCLWQAGQKTDDSIVALEKHFRDTAGKSGISIHLIHIVKRTSTSGRRMNDKIIGLQQLIQHRADVMPCLFRMAQSGFIQHQHGSCPAGILPVFFRGQFCLDGSLRLPLPASVFPV